MNSPYRDLISCVESMKSFGMELKERLSRPNDDNLRRMTYEHARFCAVERKPFHRNHIRYYVNKEMGKMSSNMNEVFEGKVFDSETY